MPTLSFPSNPSLNDTYTFGGKTWVYNGSAWDLQTQGAINGIVIGNVTPAAGTFTTLTSTGNTTLGDVAGDLVPAANLTYSLGNATNQWANIYVGGNTIFLGGLQLKDDGGNTLGVYAADGTTPAAIDATAGLAQYVTQAAQGNITSVGTLTSLTVTGNISSGNLSILTGTATVGNIVNANANGVGNIGTATTYFNTVFAKATSAQYADLAEIYTADADYSPGTVVAFGGAQEITQSLRYAQTSVAGVVSTNPAYVMNAGANGLPVALQGRVPCRVVGTIRKGDLVAASDTAGAATRLDPQHWAPGAVIGKALGDHDSDVEGMIEVVVGRV